MCDEGSLLYDVGGIHTLSMGAEFLASRVVYFINVHYFSMEFVEVFCVWERERCTMIVKRVGKQTKGRVLLVSSYNSFCIFSGICSVDSNGLVDVTGYGYIAFESLIIRRRLPVARRTTSRDLASTWFEQERACGSDQTTTSRYLRSRSGWRYSAFRQRGTTEIILSDIFLPKLAG